VRKTFENSAQALDELVSTIRMASIRGRRWLDPEQARGLARLDAAPELLFPGQQQMLAWIRRNRDLDPFSAPVMIDRAAALVFVTHILCCSCAMYFSAAASTLLMDE
jgi:hypothetical protein